MKRNNNEVLKDRTAQANQGERETESSSSFWTFSEKDGGVPIYSEGLQKNKGCA